MDSIKCSKCGKEVSSTDEVCPQCGYIFNEPQEENNQINTKPPRKPLFNIFQQEVSHINLMATSIGGG